MSEKPNFICDHLYLIEGPLVGEGSWLSLSIQEAIRNGRLKSETRFGGVCDWRVPDTVKEINGQDIGCVGPNDKRCPDPSSAQIISVDDILTL